MTTPRQYRESLEAFNRASHSDALREMQYVDPVRPTPARIIRSMDTRDFVASITIAALAVLVVPGVLLVLSVVVR